MKNNLPELLAPAGSPDALDAALAAGADAVYFGAKTLNARHGAENFDDVSLFDAVRKCRALGVKTNITINTEIYGRELMPALSLVGDLMKAGADAFIVADLGLARAIKMMYPSAVLHASTQASGQNAYSARALEKLGFSRMVAPRELCKNDLIQLCKTSPIETEIFVHGALCVSFSGQCLMSSVIGGRSGNRGECAQPCRLPYRCASCYPLSLKDSCLAGHITEILPLGVASLKIEGRMKSADYVYGVTKIYRALLDEGRNADESEIVCLADLFSRSGFTDGYFTSKIGSDMLGVRTDEQKKTTAATESAKYEKRRLPIRVFGDFSSVPASVTACAEIDGESVTATAEAEIYDGDYPALDAERIRTALSKCGATVFEAENVDVASGDGARLPLKAVNEMRRAALAKLFDNLTRVDATKCTGKIPDVKKRTSSPKKTAYFAFADAITEAATEYFDNIFIPLDQYLKLAPKDEKIGFAMPPVTFDGECGDGLSMVGTARALGATAALVTSLWQTEILGGLTLFGDIRFNVVSAQSADVLRSAGIGYVIASPEISPTYAHFCDGAVMYGRLPLMTTVKCAIKDVVGVKSDACRYCDTHRFTTLVDRTGAEFIITREPPHKNVIYNSVPVWMCDKAMDFDKNALGAHFIFTDETPDAVDMIIQMAKEKKSLYGKFKRL
ncbi:MAG: U32 family peptidase [Clostridia bacterium]|nr:U32 family peptidase [Clostridia bacterium]